MSSTPRMQRAAKGGSPNSDLVWHFSQVFGDKVVGEIAEADIISAVEFNPDGSYLATGDRGGRCVLFERNEQSEGGAEYRFYTEFQSHEPEFDYLKSIEIEEKINKISWLRRQNASHFLLTTNDKTIKLWKVHERDYWDEAPPVAKPGMIRVPVMKKQETRIESRVKRVFANAHTYHINSISVNSDGETFISADDLRVNLWNLNVSDQSFNIVDIKPPNMEELAEVITCADFHPTQCNTFLYSSSKGTIKMADLRTNALCDNHTKLFEEPADPSAKSFFSEIISSISHARFSNDGRFFSTRDYMSVKIWDTAMEKGPVATYAVHEFLRPKLCDLYENDCIFDKFEAVWSGDDKYVMTGSYNNNFRITNRATNETSLMEASRENISGPTHTINPVNVLTGPGQVAGQSQVHVDNLDFNLKTLHTTWHPTRPIIAIAATNNLYIFKQ